MKLSYFELLSPDPVYVQGIGGILSPTLRDISRLGYNKYQYYLTMLLMDPKTYLSLIDYPEKEKLLSGDENPGINIFQLLSGNQQSCLLLQDILNFFIKEDILYSPDCNGFIAKSGNQAAGIITEKNYPYVCDLIFQRNCIKPAREEDLSAVKNKKALEIMKKLRKGRAEKNRQPETDKNMELGNIMSAVANRSQSLNILNVPDLTIFQLWDCFSRLLHNNIYDIQSMSVAAWGNKENSFDVAAWFKRTNDNN